MILSAANPTAPFVDLSPSHVFMAGVYVENECDLVPQDQRFVHHELNAQPLERSLSTPGPPQRSSSLKRALGRGILWCSGHSKRRRQKGIRTHSGTGETRSKYRIAQRMHGGTE